MNYVLEILKNEISRNQKKQADIRYVDGLETEKEKIEYKKLTHQILELKEALSHLNLR